MHMIREEILGTTPSTKFGGQGPLCGLFFTANAAFLYPPATLDAADLNHNRLFQVVTARSKQ
jgi:hypothetical protein